MRKGMAIGKGKGYKNIIGKDPKIHSQSAKGMKQPQKLSPRVQAMLKKNPSLKNKSFKQLQKAGVFLKYQADSDKDGVPNIRDCKPLDKKRQDDLITEVEFDPSVEKKPTKTQQFLGKAGALAGRVASASKELGKKAIKTYKEKQEEKRIKELQDIKHPLAKDLEKQQSRVAEIEKQIADTDDEAEEEELFTELGEEKDQLRDIQEKITDLKLEDLSDQQLKTLAIRHQDDESFFADFFGTGDNKYTKELKRRIRAEKTIEKELDEVRKEKPEDSGFF